MAGELLFRKSCRAVSSLRFMQSQPTAVVMEARGSVLCWARELMSLGHEINLIAPQYMRPFVKR